MSCTINLDKYKGIIYNLACRICKQDKQLELEDLVQSGYEAVIRSYKKFDKNKGTKFSTYIYSSILREMRQEQNRQKNMVRIPRSIMDFAGHLYKAEKIYNTEKEIVNYIEKNSNLTLNQAQILYNYKRISQKKDIDIDVIYNITGTTALDIDTQIDNQILVKRLEYLTSFLSVNQRLVIELKYFSDKDYSFEDIAKLLNKSIENIWVLHRSGIQRLKRKYNSKFKERI